MAQQGKLLLDMATYHVEVLVQILAAPFPIYLPGDALGKAVEDGPSNWET